MALDEIIEESEIKLEELEEADKKIGGHKFNKSRKEINNKRKLTREQRNAKILLEMVLPEDEMVNQYGDPNCPSMKFNQASDFGNGISEDQLKKTVIKMTKNQIIDKPIEISLNETISNSIEAITVLSRSTKVKMLELEEKNGKKTVDIESDEFSMLYKATKKTLELVKMARDCVQTNEIVLKHVASQVSSEEEVEKELKKNRALAKKVELIEKQINLDNGNKDYVGSKILGDLDD